MTKNGKKILITTERHEVVVVRQNSSDAIRGYCPDCRAEVAMLNLDAAVTRLGRGASEIFALIGSGPIHAAETETGHLLICSRSIAEY